MATLCSENPKSVASRLRKRWSEDEKTLYKKEAADRNAVYCPDQSCKHLHHHTVSFGKVMRPLQALDPPRVDIIAAFQNLFRQSE